MDERKKVGRPKGSTGRKTHPIFVRVPNEIFPMIQAEAGKVGIPVSTWAAMELVRVVKRKAKP